jgi:hypothetical protein
MSLNLGRMRWLGGVLALVAGLALCADVTWAQGQGGAAPGTPGKGTRPGKGLQPGFDPVFSGRQSLPGAKVGAPQAGAAGGKKVGAPVGGQIGVPGRVGGQGGVILPPGGGVAAGQPDDDLYPVPPKAVVDKAVKAQRSVRKDLLSKPGVIGVGTCLEEDGTVVIKVMLNGIDKPKLPKLVNGVKVISEVIGEWRPMQLIPPPAGPARQRRLPRPVPIGVSAFPYDEDICASGTLGCRMRGRNGQYYALSNNHVFGLENEATPATEITQPSSGDDNCPLFMLYENVLGSVAGFVTLTFDEEDPNLVDAAAIFTEPTLVGVSTLPDGYGAPRSTTVDAFLGQRVQKYGRTTGYRVGVVTGIDMAVGPVGYDAGDAFFVETIEVTGTPSNVSLGAPGDSGSLVVDMNRNPVGLLFAGGGFPIVRTLCNDIDNVMTLMRITLGEPTLVIDDSTPTIPPGKVGNSSPLVPVSPLLPVVP